MLLLQNGFFSSWGNITLVRISSFGALFFLLFYVNFIKLTSWPFCFVGLKGFIYSFSLCLTDFTDLQLFFPGALVL